MINVLHVIDKLSMDAVNPSSCTVLLGDWYSCLDASRFRMVVCTLRDPDPAGKYLEDMGISVKYLGYGKVSPKNIRAIASLIEQEHIDVVHLHGYSAANFGRIASRRTGVPNIVHEHAVLKIQPHQFLADKLLRNYTDTAIAVSEYVRNFMVRGRSIPPDRIRLIGNGIKLSKFQRRDIVDGPDLRSELDIEEGTRVVGTVTRLREEKGNEYLIRAIPGLLKKGLKVVLLVVGDGPQKASLQALAKDLRVSEEVRFLGFRSDVPDLITVFDVQAIPSLTEGFPLCMAEAMAAGSAIVATEVGGMKEIGRDEDTVLFVPPRDPDALCEKVACLLQNPDIASGLSRRATAASGDMSIEKSLGKLVQMYEELAGAAGPA